MDSAAKERRFYLVEGVVTGAVVMVEAATKTQARDYVFDRHFRMRLAKPSDLRDALRNGVEVESVPMQTTIPGAES